MKAVMKGKLYIRWKRRLDVILAGIGLIVLSPVFLCLMAAIKLESIRRIKKTVP